MLEETALMAKSTKTAGPRKPYPSFPLRAHQNGQWCKKIKGRFRLHGTWDDPKAALENYNRLEVYHETGTPIGLPEAESGLTIKQAIDRFRSRLGNGAIRSRPAAAIWSSVPTPQRLSSRRMYCGVPRTANRYCRVRMKSLAVKERATSIVQHSRGYSSITASNRNCRRSSVRSFTKS